MATSRTRQTSTTRSQTATWRVFVAVPVDDAVRAIMRDVVGELAPRGWPVKWVRPELAHLTMKFYGDIETDRLPDLAARLADVATAAQPLTVRTTGIGAFPTERRPRVLWLGLTGDIEPLAALARRVEAASAGFGRPEDRPFAPHITLGRLRDGAPAPSDFAAAASALRPAPVTLAVDRLQLVRSVLGPGGPTYTVIGEWPLGAIPEVDDHG